MNARTISVSRFSAAGATLAALLLATLGGRPDAPRRKAFHRRRQARRHRAESQRPHSGEGLGQARSHGRRHSTPATTWTWTPSRSATASRSPRDASGDELRRRATSRPTTRSPCPTETELQVRTDSGNVTVESVHGDMSFDTVAADLPAGRRRLPGDQDHRRLAGLHAMRGPPGRHLHQRQFPLVQPVMDNVRVQTSSGKSCLTAASSAAASTSSRTTAAPSKCASPATIPSTCNAASLYGNVINQAPVVPDRHRMRAPQYANGMAKSLFGSMNDGHAKVELSSFSGTIKILKRE